jgi:tetratricopeptide (TPR) repeat protein
MFRLLALFLFIILAVAPIYAGGGPDAELQHYLSLPDNRDKVNKLINFSNKQAVNQPVLALNAATAALELSYKLKDKKAEAYAYNSLGTLQYNSGNFERAIDYFKKASSLFKQQKEEKGEAYALKYLGFAYEKQKDYEKAIAYYESYESKNSSEPIAERAKVKVNKARSYENSKQPAKSRKEAAALEDKVKTLSDKDKIQIYMELGEIFLNASDSLSERFLDKAAAIESQGNAPIKPADYNTFSDLYFKQNQPEKALAYENKKIEQIESDLHNKVLRTDSAQLRLKGEEWKELGMAYEKKANYKEALNAYKNYMAAFDTLTNYQIADSLDRFNLMANLAATETRIKALEESRNAQDKVIAFQRSIGIMLSFGLLLLALGVYYLWRLSKQKETANLKLRFQSLSNRMNPHFIYNSLNSVNLFIAQNKEKEANKFLADFSKLMRMVMDNSSRELVSLKDELLVIEKYLLLEHSRFGKQFNYEITIDEQLDLEGIWVPPMVLQPYVENAIWHGIRYKESSGDVRLQIASKDNFVVCTITDNGIGRSKSLEIKTKNQKEHKSQGMKNSHERIEILNKIYNKKLSLTVSDAFVGDAEYPGTKVEVFIPVI